MKFTTFLAVALMGLVSTALAGCQHDWDCHGSCGSAGQQACSPRDVEFSTHPAGGISWGERSDTKMTCSLESFLFLPLFIRRRTPTHNTRLFDKHRLISASPLPELCRKRAIGDILTSKQHHKCQDPSTTIMNIQALIAVIFVGLLAPMATAGKNLPDLAAGMVGTLLRVRTGGEEAASRVSWRRIQLGHFSRLVNGREVVHPATFRYAWLRSLDMASAWLEMLLAPLDRIVVQEKMYIDAKVLDLEKADELEDPGMKQGVCDGDVQKP
ncbi:uncharacterized protein MYCGRDRAFT_96423 [Zymoseptoria tritici IPO323]|uniref:Uncharacterized protein n=1 Tax=Zymoseptoria tritici (strain CBS 115943 / IPO323) TaxID=336722 RepID=F9XKV6_ZYMTI|nr:uncharacterized protein MYCGRDRAFT_96423 [Zymoseptoria tritici IPO323]EGP83968.1 hypothetical protein MYCGRDRAFT_96423 [Zymoseptoria tritici IPO323]